MSFDIHKYNSGNMNKILKHNTRYRDEPWRDVKYANTDIDKTQSHLNYALGEVRADPRQYIKNRIKDIDEKNPPKRIKKDRVLMIGFSVAVPEDLVGTGKEKAFFEMVYNWECKMFGKDNIVSTDVHRDEIHDYWDKAENRWRTSREHLHSAIIPVATDDKGLKVNAFECINKERMKNLHKSFDEYIYKTLKVHTITHSEHTGRDTEDLKRESIEYQAKMLGQLEERGKIYQEIEAKGGSPVDFKIEAAKAEIQRDILRQQMDAILKATAEIAPDQVNAIKQKANKLIDTKYIDIGEKSIGL